jgi:hypothetical protein
VTAGAISINQQMELSLEMDSGVVTLDSQRSLFSQMEMMAGQSEGTLNIPKAGHLDITYAPWHTGTQV